MGGVLAPWPSPRAQPRYHRHGARRLTGPGDLRPGDRQWIFAEGWSHELGLRTDNAVERISQPSAWAAAESQADREAGE